MEEDTQPQVTAPQIPEWQPANVTLSPRSRSRMSSGRSFGGTGDVIDQVPWNQDAAYRKYLSNPPVDDMLRAHIIPPGGLTVRVMPPNMWLDPFFPHDMELRPQEDHEEKEERDLIETKEDHGPEPSEDEESPTPDPNDRSPTPPPGVYLFTPQYHR